MPVKPRTTIRPFADTAQYTAIPNAVINVIMPSVSGITFKTICYLLRHSDKPVTAVGIAEGIGHSLPITHETLTLMAARNLVRVRRAGSDGTTFYSINTTYEVSR